MTFHSFKNKGCFYSWFNILREKCLFALFSPRIPIDNRNVEECGHRSCGTMTTGLHVWYSTNLLSEKVFQFAVALSPCWKINYKFSSSVYGHTSQIIAHVCVVLCFVVVMILTIRRSMWLNFERSSDLSNCAGRWFSFLRMPCAKQANIETHGFCCFRFCKWLSNQLQLFSKWLGASLWYEYRTQGWPS